MLAIDRCGLGQRGTKKNLPHVSMRCRYSNSAMFISEMKGLELVDTEGNTVKGDVALRDHQLNDDLTIAENFAVLIAILLGIRILALVGLKLAYNRNWL